MWFLCSRRSYLRLKASNLRLVGKILWPSIALGLSPFVMQLTESVISICFNTQLQIYGGDIAVGAMTILSSVMQFAMLPLQGLTQGAQPITSFNFGAGKMDRVVKAFRILLISCLTYATALWAICEFAPQLVISIFTPADGALGVYTRSALRIYMAASLLFGAQIACQQTFVALGKAGISLFLAVLRKIILLVPLIFLLPAGAAHRAGHGSVPGRAGGGHAGRYHHLHDVRHRVRRHGQKVEAGAKSKSRRAVSRGVPCRRGT